MTDARVALPPGIYNVRSTEPTPRGVVSPAGNGGRFSVSTASATAANQQFVINEVGQLTAMDTAAHAFAVLPSTVNGLVTRSTTATQWIINVSRNPNGTFTGYIMASDTRKNFWGLDGNNIHLQDSIYNWTFISVPA